MSWPCQTQQRESDQPFEAAAILDISQGDISITDGEGEPVDISTVSSILADDEDETNWIPTTTPEFMPTEYRGHHDPGREKGKESYKERQSNGGWEKGEKEDEQEQGGGGGRRYVINDHRDG